MAYDVTTITLKGAELLASATAADRLIIAGCDATTTFIPQSEAVNVSQRPAQPFSTSTNASLEESTTNHVFVRVFFVAGQSTGGEANSLYIYGHNESDPTHDYVLAVLSSEDPFHLPVEGDISNTYGVLLDIVYNAASGAIATATSSVYATYGEYADLRDRVVTTHKRDLPTTGDNQTIYGEKTFVNTIHSGAIPDNILDAVDDRGKRFEISCAQDNPEDSIFFDYGFYDGEALYPLASIEEAITPPQDTDTDYYGMINMRVSDKLGTKGATISIYTTNDNMRYSAIDMYSNFVNVNTTGSNGHIYLDTKNYRITSDNFTANIAQDFNTTSKYLSARVTETPDDYSNNPYSSITGQIRRTSGGSYLFSEIVFAIRDNTGASSTIEFRNVTQTQSADLAIHALVPGKAYTANHKIDLGTSAEKFNNVYAETYHGDLDGTALHAGTATSAQYDNDDNEITDYVMNVSSSSTMDTALTISHGDPSKNTAIDLNNLVQFIIQGKGDSSWPFFNLPGAVGLFFYKGSSTSYNPGQIVPGTDLEMGGLVRKSDGTVTFLRNLGNPDGSWALLSGFALTNTGDSAIVLAVKVSLT